MNKTFLLPLLLLAGCSNLPSINPLPTITATVTVTATPEAKAPSGVSPDIKAPVPIVNKPPVFTPNVAGGDIYEIRFEGKKGTKVNAGYVIFATDSPTQVEQVDGILPFSVKIQKPKVWVISATISDYSLADDVKPKVFISRNGKDCGIVSTVGSAVKNPEASKGCSNDL
jgi:hypothetical protein